MSRLKSHPNWRPGQFTHGMSYSKEWRAWREMMRRCYDERRPDYHRYGGRGICVAASMHTFEGFYAVLGPCPPGHSLDRISPAGNYTPSNVRWATPTQQTRGRRDAVVYEWRGRQAPLIELANEAGIRYHTAFKRLRILKWPLEEALETPVRALGRVG